MKLSIITINYNNREGLRRTLESVRLQSTRDFEYIVIDGGSTDGSVDLIKEYADLIDYWVSEPDRGIYHAMNKGVKVAHGDYCQFLNSGDWYCTTRVAEMLLPYLDNDVDILSGYVLHAYKNGDRIRNKNGSPDYLNRYYILNQSLSHPSAFVKREILTNTPFDESYKIVGDWKFFVETIIEQDIKYRHINLDVACFDMTGVSSTQQQVAREEGAVTRRHFIHPQILKEISAVPNNVTGAFRSIPDSTTFKKFLVKVIELFIALYHLIKPNSVKKINYGNNYPPNLLKKAKQINFQL